MSADAIAYPIRTPRWVLSYDGRNITADITKMIIALSYHDKVGRHSDEVEVVIEDRDRRWQGPWFPQRGDLVGLLIGYTDGELMDAGIFQVDELELKGPPDTFHLKCIAAGIVPSIRTPRSAAYESQTLLQVSQTVAARQGLTVTGLAQKINVTWQRLTQHQETDLAFLRRLAQAHNYDFSIRGTQLVFYSRTALEAQPAILTIDRTQTKIFEFKTKTQQIYKSASVAYQNPAQKQLIGAQYQDPSSPTGDDLHIVTRIENPQQAQLKAQSALHDANMRQVTGRIETEGTTMLVAGVNIGVTGFGNFTGTYHVEASHHRLDRSGGYTTEIEVRQLTT
jgi:uncharacterized protein